MGVLLVGTSCNAYQKTLNNPDTSVKYKAAEAYYNSGSTEEPTVFLSRFYQHTSGNLRHSALFISLRTPIFKRKIIT